MATPLPPYRRYAVSDDVRRRQAELAADQLQATLDRAALPAGAFARALAELENRDREAAPEQFRMSPALASRFLLALWPATGCLVFVAAGGTLHPAIIPGLGLVAVVLLLALLCEMVLARRRRTSSAGRDTMPLEPTGRSCGRCGERSPFEARHCIECGARLLQESDDAR